MPATRKSPRTSGYISHGVVSMNRRARFNYEIIETFEAGVVLLGSEVKSLREGRVNLGDSYAVDRNGELYLVRAHIGAYDKARDGGHSPLRDRKLLLHRKQISRLTGEISRGGMTLVPIDIRFNSKGLAKITLGLGRGKQQRDKRQTIKEREWNRDRSRLMKRG